MSKSRVREALRGIGGVDARRRSAATAASCRRCRRPGRARLRRRPRSTARPAWWPRSRGRGPGRSGTGPVQVAAGPRATRSSRAPRRSCQTMARWRGAPVRRSHTTTVSRWLVMPMAATGSSSDREQVGQGGRRPRPRSLRRRARPSPAGGSTAGTPGSGRRRRAVGPTAMARTPVVPASMAMTTAMDRDDTACRPSRPQALEVTQFGVSPARPPVEGAGTRGPAPGL